MTTLKMTEPIAWVHKEYRHMQGYDKDVMTKEQADGYTNHPAWKSLYTADALRDVLEQACGIVMGNCDSDNTAQRTVNAIRAMKDAIK